MRFELCKKLGLIVSPVCCGRTSVPPEIEIERPSLRFLPYSRLRASADSFVFVSSRSARPRDSKPCSGSSSCLPRASGFAALSFSLTAFVRSATVSLGSSAIMPRSSSISPLMRLISSLMERSSSTVVAFSDFSTSSFLRASLSLMIFTIFFVSMFYLLSLFRRSP